MSYELIATLINKELITAVLTLGGISVLRAFYVKYFINAPFNACKECAEYFVEKEGCTQKSILCENCETPTEVVKRIHLK